MAAWLAKYGPVEREIIKARERRLAGRARRRGEAAKAFGDLCEATEGLADPIPAAAVLAQPEQRGDERDHGSDEVSVSGTVPELAVVRARAVWLEATEGVRGSATALMERFDALTDPERVEDAAMFAGWRAKYENEITERMKCIWWRRMGRRIGGAQAV